MLVLEAEIEDVFVVREARRRGVGQRLVVCAIARSTAKGCRSLGDTPPKELPRDVRLAGGR